MALGITGQRQKNKLATVAIETLPTVSASEILKPGSLINRRDLSGKNEGAMVLVTDGPNKGIYVALDDKRDGHWMYLHGVSTEGEVGRDTVREIDDMVDVELEGGFENHFTVADARIDTKVIETPVLLLDGTYAYRCRMTFDFNCTRKDTSNDTEVNFTMNLVGETGDSGQYLPVDHATFTAWVNSGVVLGHIDSKTATTNNIPVRLHITEGAGRSFNFSFSLEWTSTEQIQEG